MKPYLIILLIFAIWLVFSMMSNNAKIKYPLTLNPSMSRLRSSSEPYIGKIFQPKAGPTQPSDRRAHFTLYDNEPFLTFSPNQS